MAPVLIVIFTVGALSNIYTVLRCFQSSRVWRNLGWFTPFAAFLLSLNIGTFGALLFLAKSQDSVPRNLTAACVAGPTAAFFSVSISIFNYTALTINYLGRVHRRRFSTKQVLLIMAMTVFASGLLLSPAIRAAVEETPVITTEKCVETGLPFHKDVINVKRYAWWVRFLQFYIPGFINMAVLSRLAMVRNSDANVSCLSETPRVYTTIRNLLMLLMMAPFVVFGGQLLWEFEFFSYTNEVEVQHFLELNSVLISLNTVLFPMQLMFFIELEISEVVSRQAESSGRLIEDKAACCAQNVNENTDAQNV